MSAGRRIEFAGLCGIAFSIAFLVTIIAGYLP